MIRKLIAWMDGNPGKAGTFAGWFLQGSSALSAIGVVPIVIRLLGDSQAGLWFALNGFVSAIALTDMGIGYVLARQVAFTISSVSGGAVPGDFVHTGNGWEGASRVFNAGRRLASLSALAAGGLVLLICHVVLPAGKLVSESGGEVVWTGYMLGLSGILLLLAKPHAALVEGVGKLHWSRFLAGIQQLLAGGGSLLAVLIGGGIREMAGVVCVFSLLYLIAIRRLAVLVARGQLDFSSGFPAGLPRKLFSVAFPLGIVNTSSYLISSIQVPLLGSILGPTFVPPLYLAQKVSQLANQAVMQTVYPQLPRFTGAIGAGDDATAARLMGRTFRLGLVFSAVANLCFVMLSPLAVEIVVGAGRYPNQLVLWLVATDSFIMTSCVLGGQFVLASGRNPFLWSTLWSGVVSLCMTPFLVARFGILGVPVGSLITGLLINYWYVPACSFRLFRWLVRRKQSRPPQ